MIMTARGFNGVVIVDVHFGDDYQGRISQQYDLMDPNEIIEMQKFFKRCLGEARLRRVWRATKAPFKLLWQVVRMIVLHE